MRTLGDLLAVLLGVVLIGALWWGGARQHLSVQPHSVWAAHVAKPIARLLGSVRPDNIVDLRGVYLQLAAYQLAAYFLLVNLSSISISLLHDVIGITTWMLILVGGVHVFRKWRRGR